MKYIGCDAHVASCTFHVIDRDGKSMNWRTIETNVNGVINGVRQIY